MATDIRGEIAADKMPELDTTLLFDLYALLVFAKGPTTTGEDVHDAWVVWMTSLGETHPAMVPYSQLDSLTRAEDNAFLTAIRRVAARHMEL